MSDTVTHAPGTFCWVDLATTDAGAAQDFYTRLFGWTAEDVPTDQGVPYTMLHNQGRHVCALFPLGPDMGDQPRWQAYVSVEDADSAVESAAALGGRVLMPPMDVMNAGRMAAIKDPTGAVFCLWQPGEHAGAELQNAPGSQCWLELQTGDTARAEGFYNGLFGWTAKVSQSVMEGQYQSFVSAGREVAGMMEIGDDWGPVPPNWAVYFCVEDCDACVAEAERLGGKTLFPAMTIPDVGRFAFLQDTEGAGFAVIQLSCAS